MIHAEAEFFGTSSTTGSKAFLSRLAAGLRIQKELNIARDSWKLWSVFTWRHDGPCILVFPNNEITTMLVFHTNPVGDKPFSYVKIAFISINLHSCCPREWKRSIIHTPTMLFIFTEVQLWTRRSMNQIIGSTTAFSYKYGSVTSLKLQLSNKKTRSLRYFFRKLHPKINHVFNYSSQEYPTRKISKVIGYRSR